MRCNITVTRGARTCSKNACWVAPIATASSGTRPVPKGVSDGKLAFTDEFTFGICAIPASEGPGREGASRQKKKKSGGILRKGRQENQKCQGVRGTGYL